MIRDMGKYKIKKNINAFLFTLYLSIIWMINVYIVVNGNKTQCFLFSMPITILIYFGSCKGFRWCSDIIAIKDSSNRRKGDIIVFVMFSIGSLLLILPWFIARYPGSFSPDSISQYGQVLSGVYNDWHPYWHTLVFFTFPLKLTGQTASIVLLQMIYFSIALGYSSLVIYKIAGFRIGIISQMYVLLNPYTGHILLYPWKDVGFAIASLASVAMAVDYFFFKEVWARKWWRFILLGVTMANATLFRHNAILLTAPLALALLFHMQKRQWLWVSASFLVLVFFVRVPLFYILDVGKPQQRGLEMVGLPMTIIGNVVKETPEALDEEMAEFVYSIASQELWEAAYFCGNFNAIKWQKGADMTPIDEAGALKILRLTAKCFTKSPRKSLMALFTLTDMVYGLEGDMSGEGWGIAENKYGITYAGNDKLSACLNSYTRLFNYSICRYLKHIGTALLFMLAAMLAKSRLNRWEDWKKIFLWMPIFVYDFGTMMLLSGEDSRFFYVTFLVCPITAVFVFYMRGAEQG